MDSNSEIPDRKLKKNWRQKLLWEHHPLLKFFKIITNSGRILSKISVISYSEWILFFSFCSYSDFCLFGYSRKYLRNSVIIFENMFEKYLYNLTRTFDMHLYIYAFYITFIKNTFIKYLNTFLKKHHHSIRNTARKILTLKQLLSISVRICSSRFSFILYSWQQ